MRVVEDKSERGLLRVSARRTIAKYKPSSEALLGNGRLVLENPDWFGPTIRAQLANDEIGHVWDQPLVNGYWT